MPPKRLTSHDTNEKVQKHRQIIESFLSKPDLDWNNASQRDEFKKLLDAFKSDFPEHDFAKQLVDFFDHASRMVADSPKQPVPADRLSSITNQIRHGIRLFSGKRRKTHHDGTLSIQDVERNINMEGVEESKEEGVEESKEEAKTEPGKRRRGPKRAFTETARMREEKQLEVGRKQREQKIEERRKETTERRKKAETEKIASDISKRIFDEQREQQNKIAEDAAREAREAAERETKAWADRAAAEAIKKEQEKIAKKAAQDAASAALKLTREWADRAVKEAIASAAAKAQETIPEDITQTAESMLITAEAMEEERLDPTKRKRAGDDQQAKKRSALAPIEEGVEEHKEEIVVREQPSAFEQFYNFVASNPQGVVSQPLETLKQYITQGAHDRATAMVQERFGLSHELSSQLTSMLGSGVERAAEYIRNQLATRGRTESLPQIQHALEGQLEIEPVTSVEPVTGVEPVADAHPEKVTMVDEDGVKIEEVNEEAFGDLDEIKDDDEVTPKTTVEQVGGETEGEGADGRDDLLEPDEAKTLLLEDFRWVQGDSEYLTKASRGKIGYGSNTDVQRIEPFGIKLKKLPEESKGDSVFKQTDERFEPFRGLHEIVRDGIREGMKPGMESDEIVTDAQKPFAKIGGKIIWIPYYERVARFYFTSEDYSELVSYVVDNGGELKLKAPPQDVVTKMKSTIESVRDALSVYGVKRVKLRHGGMHTQYAEWLELKQIMKALSKYQQTTTGEYNQAGLFSGNLREAVSRAIDEAVGKVGEKRKRQLGRGLEGSKRVKTTDRSSDDPASFQPYNPFMVRDEAPTQVHATLPQFI